MNNQRPKIGLVLGSGGFRGFAHIGVLKVFQQNNIPIDFIAGTSVGALWGGAYALNKDIEKILKIIYRTGWLKGTFGLIDPAIFPHRGFLGGDGLEDFIHLFVENRDFSDTLIPFKCIACDLEIGQEIVLDKGKLAPALRASMSATRLFKPFPYQKHLLVDGDLVNPLPVNLAKKANCNIIIASSLTDKLVDNPGRWSGITLLNPIWKKLFGDKNYWRRHKYNLFNLISRTSNILKQKMVQLSLDQADIKITPQVSIKNVRWSKIHNARHNLERLVMVGEEAAKKALPEIKKLISHKK